MLCGATLTFLSSFHLLLPFVSLSRIKLLSGQFDEICFGRSVHWRIAPNPNLVPCLFLHAVFDENIGLCRSHWALRPLSENPVLPLIYNYLKKKKYNLSYKNI